MRLWVRLTVGQTRSDWPLVRYPHRMRLWVRLTFGQTLVRLTFGQMYHLAETSCGQVWYYFGSVWHLVRTLGEVDIWSDIPPPGWGLRSGWNLVRCLVRLNFGQTYLPGWGFRSGWHLVRLLVRLNFEMYPPGWGFMSGWHPVRLLVRCTPRMRLHVRLTSGKTLGWVDLWSDVPSRMRLWVRIKFGQSFGQVELWSDVPPGEALGEVDHWSDVLPSRHLVAKCDTTLDQVDI